MKKILITGATGFVGSHALEYFSTKNYEVFGTAYNSNIDVSKHIDQDHLININLFDKNKVDNLVSKIKPDFVIHLAALSSPKKSFDTPHETIDNNVAIQINLFEALLKLETFPEKILVIGSAEEYGLVKESDCPVDENTPLKPTNPYAVSKITQDYLGLQYFLSHKLPIVRLRPFNHTGERRPPIFVLPAFAKQIAEIEADIKEPVLTVGNLTPIRDFTYVKDMIKAYELALLKTKPGEVYNIGSSVGISIQKLLDHLLSLTDKKIEVQIDKKLIKPADVPVLIADSSKFSKITGWKPETDIQETVKRVLNYWRSQVENK